jgi:putative oxidoreductase
MTKIQDLGLLVMRLAFAAFMVIGHGWGKFQALTSGEPIRFGDPIGLGPELSFYLVTSAEFLFAILVGLGVLTRLSLLPLIINMAVAAFVAHADDPFGRKEMSLLYLTAWVGLFLTGPGRYTLQNLMAGRLNSSNRVVQYLTR